MTAWRLDPLTRLWPFGKAPEAPRTCGLCVARVCAARAWAAAFHALREAHDELLVAGRFLERKRPDVLQRWPSLFVSVGAAKKRASKASAAPATPPSA